MTIRPRAVRALRDVRERLRDAAATDSASAAAARDGATHEVAHHELQLATYLETAQRELATASSVHQLDRVADHTGVHRLAIADAHARAAAAHQEAERAAEQLRVRARQLKSIERVLDRVEHEALRREARGEQRAHDDLSTRKVSP